MATVKARQDVPDAAKMTVDLVDRLGFGWELDYEYPVDKFDLTKRVQIREERHYVPQEGVTRFAAAMRQGHKFPPVVVSSDGYVVDGNTRIEAARRNRFPTMQTVVLSEPYEAAPDSVKRRYTAVGAAANASNGKGIDKKEIRDAVILIGSDPTYTATRIGAILGIPEHYVQSYLAEGRTVTRAKQLGLDVNDSFTAAQLRLLGKVRGVNDPVWRRLFTLVKDSGMAPTELRDLLKSVRESGSEQKATAILTEERESRRQQIAEYKATAKSKPPVAAQLRQHLGFVLRDDIGIDGFVEYNRNQAAKHLETVEQAIGVLRSVVEAQGRFNAEQQERAA